MAKSVRDAALMLNAMIGSDPADAATKDADSHKRDYTQGLSATALQGMRVAVLRPEMTEDLKAQFERSLDVLRAAGATLVDVERPKAEGLGEAENAVLMTELKADLDAYLATTPPAVTTRTLDQVIAFDDANKATEQAFFGQELFLAAAKTHGLADAEYLGARAKSVRLAGKEGIDAMLAKANATVLVMPTYGPAWLSEPVYGDQYGGPSSSEMPAIAGYPNLTVPMGLVRGLPVGISFIGPAYSEQALLKAGYAYEQASKARVVPRYLPTVDTGPVLDSVR